MKFFGEAGFRSKRNRCVEITLLACLCVGCAQAQDYPCRIGDGAPATEIELGSAVFPIPDWTWIPSPQLAGFSREGLNKAAELVQGLNTTSLMVVVGGRVLMDCGDVTHVSYLASVRKSILAMLYGTYVANRTIDLGKTLAAMEMDDEGGLLAIERKATIENLISARSGIYHPASNPGDNLASAPPRGSQQPGTYYLYSNWDFNAASGAFERATRKDLYDVLDVELARPIGMQDFERSRHRKSGDMSRSRYPAYHMHLSIRDMARVGYLMLREGNWNGEQLVPGDWARRIVSIVTPVEEMNPAPLREGPFGYGYMWWVWDGPHAEGAYQEAYSGRGAYGQYITILPRLGLVVVHKTDPNPQARPDVARRLGRRQAASTSWEDFAKLLDLIVAAKH